MEKKSNVGLYVVLGLLCIFVGVIIGLVVYDKLIDTNDKKNNNGGNTIHYKDETVKFTGDHQEISIKSSDVPEKVEEIFGIIGLPYNNSKGNHMLNYYLSNDNYDDYTALIISYYGNTWDENSLFKNVSTEVSDSSVCMSSGFCKSIAKEDAERIYKLYGFSGDFSNFFKTTNLLEDQYVFIVQNTSVPPMFNSPDAVIYHNISDYALNDDTEKIVDKQIIKIVDEKDYSKLNVYVKKVTYNLKKDEKGSYYLSSVSTEDITVEDAITID